jgi:hypothetical protein
MKKQSAPAIFISRRRSIRSPLSVSTRAIADNVNENQNRQDSFVDTPDADRAR